MCYKWKFGQKDSKTRENCQKMVIFNQQRVIQIIRNLCGLIPSSSFFARRKFCVKDTTWKLYVLEKVLNQQTDYRNKNLKYRSTNMWTCFYHVSWSRDCWVKGTLVISKFNPDYCHLKERVKIWNDYDTLNHFHSMFQQFSCPKYRIVTKH